jgi:hypothetical protein
MKNQDLETIKDAACEFFRIMATSGAQILVNNRHRRQMQDAIIYFRCAVNRFEPVTGLRGRQRGQR